jgi:large subunit ribosomal protein L19
MASLTVIQDFERRQMDAITAKRRVPEFAPGDTVKVMVKVIEGLEDARDKKKGAKPKVEDKGPGYRLQAYERVFPIYSPYIAEIEVLRRGKVRRAKLYYLRGRRGKSARIFERTDARAKRLNAAFKGFKRPKGDADDLTRIQGVTADLAGQLNGLGVIKFDQVANFSDDDIANVDETLSLGGRIEKDDWVRQAQALLAELAAAEVSAADDKADKGDAKKG